MPAFLNVKQNPFSYFFSLGILLPSLLASGPLVKDIPAATSSPNSPILRQASERKSVDLTVYNSNFALIRETRTIVLEKGTNGIMVPEVPATIDPTSLHFSSLTDPAGVKVLEQNYEYDLVDQAKLLEKYIGKVVEFKRMDPDKKNSYLVSGKLLSANNNSEAFNSSGIVANLGLVAEIDGKIEINPTGNLILPSLPEGLVLKPQLKWMLSSVKEGEHKAEIGYLANAISWNCDYVVLLNKDDDRIDLKGWVTLVNNSGTRFKNAGLKLVAGDVHRVREPAAGGRVMAMAKFASPESDDQGFQQKELFEYKIYSLQRKTDINNNESKQIELVSGKNAPAKKILVYDGMENGWRYLLQNEGYRNQGNMGQESNPKVGVYLTFKNDEKSGLGMPLPKGKVRVYKRDSENQEQFIGENELDHTAKDEDIRLYLGNAFDLVGSRTQTDFRSLASGHVVEETFEIKVRNHKKENATVLVYEHPWRWSQWEVVKSSVMQTKVDQTTLKFELNIPPDQEKTVVYTIRYTW